MRDTADMEALVRDESLRMANAMLQIAQTAGSEEDVRLGCSRLITDFLNKAGIEARGQHEYGLAGGRVDSVYGGVIIEYKDPKGAGKITADLNAPGTKAVISQIQKRFVDFNKEEKVEPNRLFAAGCDGKNLVFVRKRGGKFEIENPQPVTPYTVSRLLRALISLGARGKSFTPDNLDADFGGQSVTAQSGIADLYRAITNTQNPKAQTFFQQWKILFGEVCGYDMTGRKQYEKIVQLGNHYGIANAHPTELLFAVQSYYALFMKFLAAEIASSFSPIGASILKRCIGAPTSNALRSQLQNLEQGGIWAQLGISNFLEGDLFSWYLDAWDDSLADTVRSLVGALDQYDPTTLSVEPAESRDLLKKLYHRLFPKSVRHDLGEYYTPDWLAEFTLDELEYDGNPDKRLLDPACGSGTFLVMAINRVKAWYEQNRDQCGFGETELIQKILANIIGFDLNPLAVMAARTNYLIALRDLLKSASAVEIPVYLCDAIMTPADYGGHLFAGGSLDKVRDLKTSAGLFHIPAEIIAPRETLGKYADLLEHCIRNGYTPDEFVIQCQDNGLPVEDADLHRDLYAQLRTLHAENKNGIWARIIKNAFAPLFIGEVDYIAGNPPWVNWEHLPGDYRNATKELWQQYGLFNHKGLQARLGGGKDDLAILFTYVAHDCYLKQTGKLGFVITQSVFKTKGAGEGFRQFQYPKKDKQTIISVKPVCVNDFGKMKVFDGAANRTAVFIAKKELVADKSVKGYSVTYPVPYTLWCGASRIPQETELSSLKKKTARRKLIAVPIDETKANSPWLTTPPAIAFSVRKAIGASSYKAKAGCSTWLNGVYWIRILDKLSNGNLLIENLYDSGDTEVESIQTAIEPDLVYPLLRGRDVKCWGGEPSAFVILTNRLDRFMAIPEADMKHSYPKTYAYLKKFEIQLRKRSGYKKFYKLDAPFYAIYNVGSYTLAPWKVVWKDMGNFIQAGVVGEHGGKVICPEHHAMAVSLEDRTEAHYLCAVLMSSPAQVVVACYTTTTGISTHVLENVAVPRYKPDDARHRALATLSEQCHTAAAAGDTETIAALEKQIDELAAQLWNIMPEELDAIHEALADMKATYSASDEESDETSQDAEEPET